MKTEQRQEAIFGSYDGVVSITGFIFGLLIHHVSHGTIAIGGLGGAIAAGVSMGTGELEKGDGWIRRLPIGITMLLATLAGSMIPVIPFFFLSSGPALVVAIIGCFAVATWIGFEKHKGFQGYLVAYITLVCAALLTLGIVSAIPASA